MFQPLTIFTKHSILDIWQGSEYASGLLKLLCRDSKRDTREGWYMSNWLNYLHQNKNFPLFRSHKRKYNNKASERLTKVKKMINH